MKQLYETAIDPNLPLEYRYEALKKLIERVNEMKLTRNVSQVYEAIKEGLKPKEIAEKVGLCEVTVNLHIGYLMKTRMIKRFKAGRIKTYQASGRPYELREKEPEPRVKVPFNAAGDPFLSKQMNVALTDDQIFYLKNHRSQKRTDLAKRLGLTKLQLNFALERIGSA